MRLDKASKEHPEELFQLIDSGEVWVAIRVYQNLLDCLRAMGSSSYETHRKPYHDSVIETAKAIQKHELDYVVRNTLSDKQISKVNVEVNGKRRTYKHKPTNRLTVEAEKDQPSGEEYTARKMKGTFTLVKHNN